MSYQSPVALLRPEQIENFSPADLKKIRSELLLQFQFSSDPSVMIQERPYVKDDVLQLMEEFQENPELHLYIFKNKSLLHFLENGDVVFFNEAAYQFNDQRYQLPVSVHPLVVDALDEQLPKWIQPIDNATTILLKGVQKVLRSFDLSLQEKAYGSTFVEMQGVIGVLDRDFKEPFDKPGGYGVSREVEGIVNREFLEYFKYLPASFEKLRYDYCNWCNNRVVYPFVSRQENFGRFHRNTLHVIKEAAYIASTAVMKEANLEIAATIGNYLVNGGAVKGKSSRSVIWLIIAGLVFLFRIGSLCNRQHDRSSSRNYYPTYQDNTQIYNQGPSSSIAKHGSSNESISTVKPARYNGSAYRPVPKPVLVKSKDSGKLISLKYTVDIFPTRMDLLKNYIPKNILKKYSGQTKKVQFQFAKKGLPQVVFSHDLEVEISNEGEIISAFPGSYTGALYEVPRDIAKTTYKGFITLMDTTGKVINRDTITISKTPGATFQHIYNGKKVEILPVEETSAKNILIKSLALSNNIKSLKRLPAMGNNQTIQTYFYPFDTNRDSANVISTKCRQLSFESIQLYSLFASSADSVGYYGVLTDLYDLKYMVNLSSGRVMGLQMTIVDHRGEPYVERLEAYYVKED